MGRSNHPLRIAIVNSSIRSPLIVNLSPATATFLGGCRVRSSPSFVNSLQRAARKLQTVSLWLLGSRMHPRISISICPLTGMSLAPPISSSNLGGDRRHCDRHPSRLRAIRFLASTTDSPRNPPSLLKLDDIRTVAGNPDA